MEYQQVQAISNKSSANPKSLITILGLGLVSLIGLTVILYSYFYLFLAEVGISGIIPLVPIPLVILAILGVPYAILRKKLATIGVRRCIYEWTLLLFGGGAGLVYYLAFLIRILDRTHSVFTDFLLQYTLAFTLLSSLLLVLLFMAPFAYLGNYLARAIGEGWGTGNLKLFLKPELIVVLFILALYVVVPISANQIRISTTQGVLSQITLSNFQESLIPDPESKVKKLRITANLAIPESGIYTFNNNIHNQEIDKNYHGQFRLNYAVMAIDEEIKSRSNFYYRDLQYGSHEITFEKSFKDLFEPFISPTLFQEIVADRNLYIQVRIWKGNRMEDNPFFVYVYKTNKYTLSDFGQ